MAQDITLLNASYSDVPAVLLPKTGGGTARFTDTSGDTVDAANLIDGYTAHDASGNLVIGALGPMSNADIDSITGGSGPALNLQEKTNIDPTTESQTITYDTGYDGLSFVQINAIPAGTAGTPTATKGSVSNHAVTITPKVTNATGYIEGGTKTGAAVSVSASELVGGNKAITENGANIDVTNYETVSVDVQASGTEMNVQVGQSTTRIANTSYTEACSLTCAKSGTYDVYWDCFRSTTSGTSGSRLYINGTAYGSANITFSNHAQNNHLTGVEIAAGQEVAVYARSRATNYYAYVGTLTIVQTA